MCTSTGPKVLLVNNLEVACKGAEEITYLCSLHHSHHAVAIHSRLQGTKGTHFGDNNICSHALCPHGHTPATPSVPAHDKNAAGKKPVCGPNDAVDGGLPRSVTIVEEVLRIGVVNSDDGILKHTLFRHAPQADDSRRRFLCSAHNLGNLEVLDDGGGHIVLRA
jgi:hypothetical protein